MCVKFERVAPVFFEFEGNISSNICDTTHFYTPALLTEYNNLRCLSQHFEERIDCSTVFRVGKELLRRFVVCPPEITSLKFPSIFFNRINTPMSKVLMCDLYLELSID